MVQAPALVPWVIPTFAKATEITEPETASGMTAGGRTSARTARKTPQFLQKIKTKLRELKFKTF